MKIDTFLFCEQAKKDVTGGFTLMGVLPTSEVMLPEGEDKELEEFVRRWSEGKTHNPRRHMER